MVCLKLEDAPSYDTLWQIWVLKTMLKIFEPLDVGVAIFERTPVVKDG